MTLQKDWHYTHRKEKKKTDYSEAGCPYFIRKAAVFFFFYKIARHLLNVLLYGLGSSYLGRSIETPQIMSIFIRISLT